MPDRYRVGRHFAHNIYLGDEPVGHGQTSMGFSSFDNAARLVADANAGLDCADQLATMTAVAKRLETGWVANHAHGYLTGEWWHPHRDLKEPMTDAEQTAVDALEADLGDITDV